MESITIDNRIIPLNFDVFHELSVYEKYVYVHILNTERIYRRYGYNDISSDTYINICKTLDFGYDELSINSDDDMVLENHLVNTQDRYYNDLDECKKNRINCKCPYEYRSFFINFDNMNRTTYCKFSSYSYCKCCQKKQTFDTMKKEELVKKRKCGLYLASDLSSENVLNVLPNDISKYVVQYI